MSDKEYTQEEIEAIHRKVDLECQERDRIPVDVWRAGVKKGKELLKKSDLSEIRTRSVHNWALKEANARFDQFRTEERELAEKLFNSVMTSMCGYDYNWAKVPKLGCAHGLLDVTEIIEFKLFKKNACRQNAIELCQVPSGHWTYGMNYGWHNGGGGWAAFTNGWGQGFFKTREQCLNHAVDWLIERINEAWDVKPKEKKFYLKQFGDFKGTIESTTYYQPELF